ncbi:serine/threonine protein kinase [Spirosoma utsteinense]|uniref:non-specific serine/threonine protein kinase n=1 Tax=Spirosoma utsteinense TaxID=2585773 RepID=A0ABR6WD82_9BACT|nr:serine/threonine-protein kinase [Spirosoma utsteinense]MBC3788749.1 serine/threonine-protein kinase [Spirosoma utsteinense]MBC3794521.1 serine/threonine-protein kinase [Spirosoma utsteinense]
MPTVSINTHFPGYEIIGEIGRSNARVLKARHLDTGDLVAIKHFALNTDAETLRRFRLESQLMTDIRHPNVVRVREVQLDMAMPFIVMEWIEGGSLRVLLAEGGHLDVPTTIRLGLQMAEAFKAIHPRGIIHRDIKPENILYRPLPSGELHFLLTDFGVARLREQQTQTMTGQSLMTYEYASPEQFDNPRGVDVATDYYALGVVLYECLAGRVPFSMADSAGIATFMNQVLRTPPPPVAMPQPGQYVPPSLNTLLSWMLAKDPAERLSEVNELALLLGQANVEQLQAGRSENRRPPVSSRTMAAPAGVPQPAPDPYEYESEAQTNWWGIMAGVLIIGGLVGLIFFYTQRQKTPVSKIMQDTTVVVADSSDMNVMDVDSATTQSDDQPEETATDSTATDAGTTVPTVPATGSDAVAIPDSAATPVDSTQTE